MYANQTHSYNYNDTCCSNHSSSNHQYEELIDVPPPPNLSHQYSQSLSPIPNCKFLYMPQYPSIHAVPYVLYSKSSFFGLRCESNLFISISFTHILNCLLILFTIIAFHHTSWCNKTFKIYLS